MRNAQKFQSDTSKHITPRNNLIIKAMPSVDFLLRDFFARNVDHQFLL